MESVYEQFHLLKYYGHWNLLEMYNLPILLRSWFTKRLAKQKKDEADAHEKNNPKK